MFRLAAAFLVAALTSSALAPVTCAGWQATAVERMACCERAAHDCPDQAAADACCAQQEQTHQPAATLAAIAIAVPLAVVVLPPSLPDLAIPQAAATRHEPCTTPPLHSPPGSFERPLRI